MIFKEKDYKQLVDTGFSIKIHLVTLGQQKASLKLFATALHGHGEDLFLDKRILQETDNQMSSLFAIIKSREVFPVTVYPSVK